jgi:hypothetical protein
VFAAEGCPRAPPLLTRQGSLAGIFGRGSVICPAHLQSLMLYSTNVGGKPAGNAAERWPRG